MPATGEADPPGIATYLHLKDKDLTFIRVRKNAGSSLWQAMLNAGAIQIDSPRGKTVGMWREPHNRLESTYRFFHGRGALGASSKSFEDWVWWSMETDFPCDPHLVPQVDSGNLTDIRIPWDFKQFAELIGVKSIPLKNDSKPMELHWTDDMLDIFAQRYGRDLAVWRSLTARSRRDTGKGRLKAYLSQEPEAT